MESKWQVDRTAGQCAKTGRQLQEGETYYAVLFEEGEGFRREDYSVEAWQGAPAGAFCFFKTKVPEKKKKKRLLVDDAALVDFFRRLADETELIKQQFRFVLALILMRKRLLRYEETVHEGDREYWRMQLAKTQETHRVLNPRLSEEEIELVSRELGAILHGDAGTFADEAPDPPDMPEPSGNDG